MQRRQLPPETQGARRPAPLLRSVVGCLENDHSAANVAAMW